MSGVDIEQLADSIIAQRAPRRVKQVPRATVSHTPPFSCTRCGAEHERFRDAGRTRRAAWCRACFATYVRARRRQGAAA